MESLLHFIHRARRYIWPTRISYFEYNAFLNMIEIRGWHAEAEEECIYYLTPEHVKEALGVSYMEAKWVYTPRGLLYRIDTYLHNCLNCTAHDRVISVLCNDHPMKLPGTMIHCINVARSADVRRILGKYLSSHDRVELLRGDMSIVEV